MKLNKTEINGIVLFPVKELKKQQSLNVTDDDAALLIQKGMQHQQHAT